MSDAPMEISQAIMNGNAGSQNHSPSAGPVHDLRRVFQRGRRKPLQQEQRPMNAAEAAAAASDNSKGPKDGIVAVKVWILSAMDLSWSQISCKPVPTPSPSKCEELKQLISP